jgi:hypothetical protein
MPVTATNKSKPLRIWTAGAKRTHVADPKRQRKRRNIALSCEGLHDKSFKTQWLHIVTIRGVLFDNLIYMYTDVAMINPFPSHFVQFQF